MASAIDDPDEQNFQSFANRAGRNVTDASNVVHALDERIRAIKEDCQDTQHQLDTLPEGEDRNWLIFKLQRQRLLYARYHVRKVGILKKLVDYGTLKLPGENLDEMDHDTKHVWHVTTENAKHMEDYLQKHSQPTTEKEARKTSAKPKPTSRETWQSYFQRLFDRLHSTSNNAEDETFTSHKCDTIDAARKFYQTKFADGMEPMDYDNENDSTVVSREAVLIGDGPSGASANAILERRDFFRDKRQVTEEQIRYVHEHIRSYRLETILNRDQTDYLKDELNHLYEKNPEFFRRYVDKNDTQWKEKLSSEHHEDETIDQDVQTIKIIPLDTRPTTEASSLDETGSISVTLTSHPSEIYEDDEVTHSVTSQHTTPTPTAEFQSLSTDLELLPSEKQEPTKVLLRLDDLEYSDLRHHVQVDSYYDETIQSEDRAETISRQLKDVESDADLHHSIPTEESGQLESSCIVEKEIHKGLEGRREEQEDFVTTAIEESYPIRSLSYKKTMSERPLIIVLDRFPYEWYYEKHSDKRFEATQEPAAFNALQQQTVDKHKMSEQQVKSTVISEVDEFEQRIAETPVPVSLQEEDAASGEWSEQKLVSETSQLVCVQEVEETIQKSSRAKKRLETGEDGQNAESSLASPVQDNVPTQEEIESEVHLDKKLPNVHPTNVESTAEKNEHERLVEEEGLTRYELEVEETLEQSAKTKKKLEEKLRQEAGPHYHDLKQKHADSTRHDKHSDAHEETSKSYDHHFHLHHSEFQEQPLVIRIDRYPREWYYDNKEDMQKPEQRHETREEGSVRSKFGYEETTQQSSMLKHHLEKLGHLQRDPSIELPVFEGRLVFHLLNYNQDLPHIPFHVRRRYYEESADVKQQADKLKTPQSLPVDTLKQETSTVDQSILHDNEPDQSTLEAHLYDQPQILQDEVNADQAKRKNLIPTVVVELATADVKQTYHPPLETSELVLCTLKHEFEIEQACFVPEREVQLLIGSESGRLLLRDDEFHSHLLDEHVDRRPSQFHYDVLHHHHHQHPDKREKIEEHHLVSESYKHEQPEQHVTTVTTKLNPVIRNIAHLRYNEFKGCPYEYQPRTIYDTPPEVAEDSSFNKLHHEELPKSAFATEPQTHQGSSTHKAHHYDKVLSQNYEYNQPSTNIKDEPENWYEVVSTDSHLTDQQLEKHESDAEDKSVSAQKLVPSLLIRPNEELQRIPFVAERKSSLETNKLEDSSLPKNDDVKKINYEYDQSAHASSTKIKETRLRPSQSLHSDSDINLLWREKEFRASVYELDKKLPSVEPVVRRRETDPIVRRRSTLRGDYDPPGHITHHYRQSEVHELKRSLGELGQSGSLRESDIDVPADEHRLFRSAELAQISFNSYSHGNDYDIPPRQLFEPVHPVPILTSPLPEKAADEAFLDREEELETCEIRYYVSTVDQHLHHYRPAEQHSGVFYEPKELRREQKLYRDHDIHHQPLSEPIYDSPYDAKYEEVVTDKQSHSHFKDIQVSDESIPLGQEDYLFSQLPSKLISEQIEIRPMERVRRLTDSEDTDFLNRAPEMDDLLFNETWDILDYNRRQVHRLSEIQEESMSFGPESTSNSKSSSDGISQEVYRELPQIRYDQYGKPPIHRQKDSSDSQAVSIDDAKVHHYEDDHIDDLHLESDINFLPLQFTQPKPIQHEMPVYEEIPHEHYESSSSDKFGPHQHDNIDKWSPKQRLIQHEEQDYSVYAQLEQPVPASHTYKFCSSDVSQPNIEDLYSQQQPSKSSSYFEHKDVVGRPKPTQSAVYDQPYEEEESIYAKIDDVEKTPKFPKSLPPVRPEQKPNLTQESIGEYADAYDIFVKSNYEKPQDVPTPPTKIGSKLRFEEESQRVERYVEPPCKFPNVREMVKEYSETYKNQDVPLTPTSRSQRAQPDLELQITRSETSERTVSSHIISGKRDHEQKQPPIKDYHVDSHQKSTLEYETISESECSPIATPATHGFQSPEILPFSQEFVTESQLSTPTSSEVSFLSGQVKQRTRVYEKKSASPMLKSQIASRYQPQKSRLTEKLHKLSSGYQPGSTPAQIFKKRADETVRICGDEYSVLEKPTDNNFFYTAHKHHLIQRRLLDEYTSDDHFLDLYLRTHRWDIPVYLVPNVRKNVSFPLLPTRHRQISLGVLLRRKRFSTSAPAGLDQIHLDEKRQTYYPQEFKQQYSKSSISSKGSSWKASSPGLSKSTTSVYNANPTNKLTQYEQGELFKSPAFIKARQHSDAFVWGSIHRHKGRQIAKKLDEVSHVYDPVYEEQEALSSAFSYGKRYTPAQHGHSIPSKHRRIDQNAPYDHQYDTVYETKFNNLVETQHPHYYDYRNSYCHHVDEPTGYEPIPFEVRRLKSQKEMLPQLPSTHPPKSPKAISQVVESKPISVTERLLAKTSSLERRKQPSTYKEVLGSKSASTHQMTEQRLPPLDARKTYMSEKKKWFDENNYPIRDEANEIHRVTNRRTETFLGSGTNAQIFYSISIKSKKFVEF